MQNREVRMRGESAVFADAARRAADEGAEAVEQGAGLVGIFQPVMGFAALVLVAQEFVHGGAVIAARLFLSSAFCDE
jgi:hypothetical protein